MLKLDTMSKLGNSAILLWYSLWVLLGICFKSLQGKDMRFSKYFSSILQRVQDKKPACPLIINKSDLARVSQQNTSTVTSYS